MVGERFVVGLVGCRFEEAVFNSSKRWRPNGMMGAIVDRRNARPVGGDNRENEADPKAWTSLFFWKWRLRVSYHSVGQTLQQWQCKNCICNDDGDELRYLE